MPELFPLFSCFGLVLFVLPLVLAIVALARVTALRQEIEKLRAEVARLLLQPRSPAESSQRDIAREHLLHREPQSPPAAGPAVTPPLRPLPVSIAPPPPAPPMAPPESQPAPAPESRPVSPFIPFIPTEPPQAAQPEPPAHHVPVEARKFLHPQPTAQPQKEPLNLEAFLGTRLYVVLGAIALGLAGILLVKYAVDHQWINETTRVIMGLLAGAALLGLGQWRHKKEAFLAQGLSAAGIVILFACFLAASNLYHLISPAAGFFCLVGVTVLAVVLSLQQGPFIAVLGLIGGFLTPALIRTESPNIPGLFGYLLLLHLAMVVLTRWRGWTILAALSTLFSAGWILLWLAFVPFQPEHAAIFGSFILATTFSLVLSTLWAPAEQKAQANTPGKLAITWLAVFLGLFTACLLLGRSGYSNMEWGFFACLVVGSFVLGRLRPEYEGLAWVASAAVLGLLFTWAGPNHSELSRPEDFARLRILLFAFGAASILGAYACQYASSAPVRWAALTVLLSLAYVLSACVLLPEQWPQEAWAWLPGGGAALLAVMSVPFFLDRSTARTAEECLAVYAHGVLAQLIIASILALHDAKLTAALALLLPLTALALTHLRLGSLTYGFFGLFLLLCFRALSFWDVFHYPVTPHLFWNPLVWAYGSILLAKIASIWVLESSQGRAANSLTSASAWTVGELSLLLQTTAPVCLFMLVTLVIQGYFHPQQLDNFTEPLSARATFATAWLLLAMTFLQLGRQLMRLAVARIGLILAWVVIGYLLFDVVGFENPLWQRESVGTGLIVNDLLYYFGAPAVLCGVLTLGLRSKLGDSKPLPWSAEATVAREGLVVLTGCVALLLLFLLVTTEIRQWYQGEYLVDLANHSNAEMTTYSLAWAVLGGLFLLAGIWRSSAMLRWASLVLMLATVFKVFIVDLGNLRDLLRVLSFAGLGVSLMLLGFIYQRFVFGGKPATAAQPEK